MHTPAAIAVASKIEIRNELAVRSVSENVVPPGIVIRRSHVIRNDIQQDLELMESRLLDELRPSGLTTEIIADLGRIRHVVAMLATRNRLKARRKVKMTHSKRREVRKDFLGGGQRKPSIQLQAISTYPFTAHGSARQKSVQPDRPIDCVSPTPFPTGFRAGPNRTHFSNRLIPILQKH